MQKYAVLLVVIALAMGCGVLGQIGDKSKEQVQLEADIEVRNAEIDALQKELDKVTIEAGADSERAQTLNSQLAMSRQERDKAINDKNDLRDQVAILANSVTAKTASTAVKVGDIAVPLIGTILSFLGIQGVGGIGAALWSGARQKLIGGSNV
jgi:hypothetical protein